MSAEPEKTGEPACRVPSGKRRVLLIGWDAADWQMIEPLVAAGEMPALQALRERGAWGNLATLHPVLSPILWTCIATGKTADRHGVLGFAEKDPHTGGARPWSSSSRKCKALWNILNQNRLRPHVVGWWASHPAEPVSGVIVTNALKGIKRDSQSTLTWPRDYVHPATLAPDLARYRMFADEVDASHILPFIPRAAEIDQKRDGRLENFANILSATVSAQSMATEIMEREPAWDFMAVYFEAVDSFGHVFMPYHPPRDPHIPERDFDLYKDVMRGCYRFHDMMLERLLALAGPETTVILCSDHGFHSQHRPRGIPREPAGPCVWHRDLGVLVMAGPGIRKNHRLYGAGLLDIAPTILGLYGLPAGRDMQGRVLVEAMADGFVEPERIPSWEEVEGDDGRHPAGYDWVSTAADTDEVMRHFAALGYIEDKAGNTVKAGDNAAIEARYNLAQVHLSNGEPDKAIDLMEALLRERPWEDRWINQLARCFVSAGWFKQAATLLDRAWPDPADPPPLLTRLVFARAVAGMGEEGLALPQLQLLAAATRHAPQVLAEIGIILTDIGRLDAAEQAFHHALEADPASAAAWNGLSSVHLRRRKNEACVEAALEAISLLHQQPVAHFNLGLALARLGHPDKARESLRRALQMAPHLLEAHRVLAALGGESDDFLAATHRSMAQRLSRARALEAQAARARAHELRPLPDLPSPAERRARVDIERPAPAAVPDESVRTFTVVSGLPRSGTSLMMQMLEAGGLPPKTDRRRAADEDNPEGYYEWEAIKSLARQPQLMEEDGLERCALKVISALLPALPSRYRYRVLFMQRPVAEIAASQHRMIRRRGTSGMEGTADEIAAALAKHRVEMLTWLRRAPHCECLEVDYPALVADPESHVQRIAEFLGPARLPHAWRMPAAVRPELHRQRHGS